MASIDCSKDTYEILSNTVLPQVRRHINSLKKSSVLTVYHKNDERKFKSFIVPASIERCTAVIITGGDSNKKAHLKYVYTDDNGEIQQQIEDISLHFTDVPFFLLNARVVLSTFHDFYIGDLAFLAMLLGMTNSSGHHCLLCEAPAKDFNCHPDTTLSKLRTKERLRLCLEQYIIDVGASNQQKKPANFKGVNMPPLLDVDPRRILVPILHTPMGLVDKLLESFNFWVNLRVERLPEDDNIVRIQYTEALAKEKEAAAAVAAAVTVNNGLNNPDTREALKAAKTVATKARQELKLAKEKYDPMIQRHNAKLNSLQQRFEDIFRRRNIRREYYHGGKFNGVACRSIMERASSIFLGDNEEDGFLQKILALKKDDVPDDWIRSVTEDFGNMMGILDTIWSAVRGIDCGLLPTEEQLQSLAQGIQKGKHLWLKMGLSTRQPKWHLTFDGHLLHQIQSFGGLADKADDTIEFQHQVLKRIRDRYRRVSSYQRKTHCLLRELRRQRNTKINKHVADFFQSRKQQAGTNRSSESHLRQEVIKEEKRVKREAFIA